MNSDSELHQIDPLISLQEQIQLLKDQSNLLLHRVDSMQACLKQESFDLAIQTISIKSTNKAAKVKLLLTTLELKEDGLTVGHFLSALNTYLIKHDLVDLNDLQIILNPLLCAAFQKPTGLKKVPYGILLNSLPNLFV
jgi:hypothetical protein